MKFLLAWVAIYGIAAILGELIALTAVGKRGERRVSGLGVETLGGLAALHLLLLGLDLIGMAWSRTALAAVGLAAGVALFAVQRSRRSADGEVAPPAAGRRFGWGLALAQGAVLGYGVSALTLWSATPDFVYHWGIKGHRYFLERGIDWAFLSDPLRLTDHPDYPNLLPDLYAAVAVLAGGFDARAAMLWSVLFLFLLPLFARQTWRRLQVGAHGVELGTVAVAAAAAMFALGYRLAGGGDLAIAVALAAAVPALTAREPSPGDDLRLGMAAAFAAGAKIEGIPLAGILVAVHLGRRLLAHRRGDGDPLPPAVLCTALPPLLVVLPWAAQCLRYDLFQASNPGALDLSRLPEVLAAIATALATREWHGLAWLVPLALPPLLASRRTRPLALVCALQLGFYGWVYLSSPLEPTFYVLSSFPRLAFHLLPAVLTGLVALLAPTASPYERS